MSIDKYIFKLNNQTYSPSNIGDISILTTLVTDDGAYQHVKSLSGELVFKNDAYFFIKDHAFCQKITFNIFEKCGRNEILIYNAFFTYSKGTDDKVNNSFTVTPEEDSLYKCLTDSIDREFNLLETPNIVSSEYAAIPNLVFVIDTSNDLPYFGEYIKCGGTFSPFFAFTVFAHERVTTFCQGGIPQQPEGIGWELIENRCTIGLADWVRRADVLDAIPCGVNTWATTGTLTPPPVTTDQNWFLLGKFGGTFPLWFWVDYNEILLVYGGVISLNNGRELDEVIDYGLNKVCPSLDVQSNFLRKDTNPVTGNTPSSTKGIQVHSVSDIRTPNASLPATLEKTTLRALLFDFVANKLNCFWTIDEGTKRLIIEHYKDLVTNSTVDLTLLDNGKWLLNKDNVSFETSDSPISEVFDTTETDIDFSGVPINYDGNYCASGVKNYSGANVYTDVQTIINNPDDFGNNGLVYILPNSLAPLDSVSPSGSQSEKGLISGTFKPNAPLCMANLQDKFWKYYRPFKNGEMNFINTEFEQKPITKNAPIEYPLCCYAEFNPWSKFITNQDEKAFLVTSEFSLQTGFIKVDLKY